MVTMNRYDTTGNPQAQFEPGSDNTVLKNKLGITRAAEMDDIELELLLQLYDQIGWKLISVYRLQISVSGTGAGWVMSMPGPVNTEP